MAAPTTIAQISHVRAALGSDAQAPSGAVTDNQISAALELARELMIAEVGASAYDAALRGGVVAKKLDAFRRAEALFTLSRLPQVVRGAQMSATGTRRTTTIGEAVTEFASPEEGQQERGRWEAEAYRLLAPFLARRITGDGGVTIGARSRAKNFSIVSTD